MKAFIILFVLGLLSISCANVRKPDEAPKKETPAALQDNSRDVSSFLPSKRNGNDLVDELYFGLVKENQQLKDIEKLIEENNTHKNDILGQYNTFNNKNHSYYDAANGQGKAISDSVLRSKILSLIVSSADRYKGRIANLETVIKRIEAKDVSIQDYHTAMKIVVTLPVIDDFQKNNLPKDSLYKGVYKQQDQIINKMEKIINK